MLKSCVCPICHKQGEISIKSKFFDKERSKIVFYARCNECGYESVYYDKSNKVIDFLYNNSKKDNKND